MTVVPSTVQNYESTPAYFCRRRKMYRNRKTVLTRYSFSSTIQSINSEGGNDMATYLELNSEYDSLPDSFTDELMLTKRDVQWELDDRMNHLYETGSGEKILLNTTFPFMLKLKKSRYICRMVSAPRLPPFPSLLIS